MRTTRRAIELTAEHRALLRSLVRTEARRLGWGTKYHHDENYPNGPHEWPPRLRQLERLMRLLQERPRTAGGLSWPPADSPPSGTPTARTAKT